jgi:hypothetical protein
MKSKALVRFLNRAARFDVDLELADVLDLAMNAGRLSDPSAPVIFTDVERAKHPRLAVHKATDHQRQLLVAHLKATLRSAYIKDLYEDFGAYLLDIVTAAARAGLQPGRLIGEHKFEIDANEILACTSWASVVEMVSTRLFRRIEAERNTMKLLVSIDKKLGLGVDKKLIQAAMPYLELRHLLVHQDGIPDQEFCKRYATLKAKPGKKIQLTNAITSTARNSITKLANNYDSLAVKVSLLGQTDLQP